MLFRCRCLHKAFILFNIDLAYFEHNEGLLLWFLPNFLKRYTQKIWDMFCIYHIKVFVGKSGYICWHETIELTLAIMCRDENSVHFSPFIRKLHQFSTSDTKHGYWIGHIIFRSSSSSSFCQKSFFFWNEHKIKSASFLCAVQLYVINHPENMLYGILNCHH